MKASTNHRIHAGLTFLVTVLAGGIVLCLVRSQPKSAHEFIIGLNGWLRVGFVFSLCTLFAFTMFKLLSPRLGHLRYWKMHPPAWLAAFLGLIVVALADVTGELAPDGYRATVWEWLGYAGGSLLIVGWYCETWKDIPSLWFGKEKRPISEETHRLKLQNIADAPWEDIEEWLRSDAPARYDFLDNRSVAWRLATMLVGRTCHWRHGPVRCRKDGLVHWVAEKIRQSTSTSQRYFVCRHSCWGFETSAAAIHKMLAAAIAEIGAEIDTFQVDSLPESYRRTFSASGKWIDSISNLVLRRPNPLEQFECVSELLGDMNARLIFIVEDLDRNDTHSFEIEEVLAFLERLKLYRNFSFVLTGGLLSSRKIDYAKLCDHIEYLKPIHAQHSSALVLRVREQCLNQNVFPHEPVSHRDQTGE